MVVPETARGRLAELEAEELLEMMTLAQRVRTGADGGYRPHGFNLGINLGRPPAPASLDHLHLHMVPRWNGDTSFMTVFGETRVLPEELGADGRAAAGRHRQELIEPEVACGLDARCASQSQCRSSCLAIVCSCRFDVPS